ncbi:MAG: 6-bladed beta-propeller [Solirubrobacterales bacterium]
MVEPQVTNSEVAEILPHRDLDRAGALELLQGVFDAQIQAPAGIFDELDVERFLAPDVALLRPEDAPIPVAATHPEAPASEEGESESTALTEKDELRAQAPSAAEEAEDGNPNPEEGIGQLQGAILLDSSIPLRTDSLSSEEPQAVDLSLEHTEGELQPANSLVEVGIPQELGDGIELPDQGITIELAGAPQERVASIVDQSVAFMPNVATDTDLVIAPTPTGVETFTQLRSPDSPRSQTFNFDLPPEATLLATEEGGAAVTEGEETLLSVPPPTAIDATGAEVPVTLDVLDGSMTLTVSPTESTSLPILLDPLFQTYDWANMSHSQSGICNSSFGTPTDSSCMTREEWGHLVSYPAYPPADIRLRNQFLGSGPPPKWTTGIFIESNGALRVGDAAGMIYTVPRYYTDQEKYGSMPTSFISRMTLWNLKWNALSASLSPYLLAGIWDSIKPGWVSYYTHEGLSGHGLTNMAYQYQFNNPQPNTDVKAGYVGIQGTETGPSQNTDVYVGSASIELADNGIPGIGSLSGPGHWVNQTASPISFAASDSGLGVQSLTVTDQVSPPHSWKTSYGCIGVSGAACPRTWSSTDVGPPALKYEPAVMPQGINTLTVVAEDPVGNKSAPWLAEIKVDHTAPAIALSGTMTEQAALGTKRPSYTLKVDATDGTTAQPQSGVAKVQIEFDGKVVASTEPGCSTKNCAIPIEMSIESGKFSAGQHTAKVVATDAVGLTTTKTLTIELQPSPPTVALSGAMTEQATLGTSRPRYKLKVDATAQAGLEGPPPAPSFSSSFGSAGTSNGQLSHPGDVAVDAKGNLWVVDKNNNRVQQFNAAGGYLAKFGTTGSGNGQFNRPTSLAIDAKGNIWVTDSGNNRIQQFNDKGEFLKAVGSYGAGNGQFSSPEGIAIDPKGNIWVSDTYNARLQKFNDKGEFIKVVGTKGSATGQLLEPTGIDIGPGGNVWVADWGNHRVEVYSEGGEYVRQFGSYGSGNGQFNRPFALAIDSRGNVWVGDMNNNRVQQFNQSGEYVARFGSAGTGPGQFYLGYPMGIAVDSKGSLWITDIGSNRVQKWSVPGYAPAYVSSFGSPGASAGQFNHPSDAAMDADGNLWVIDKGNNRIQKFSPNGEYLAQFGSYGSGNGQFNGPNAIDIDIEGNIWITDSGNHRVQSFNSKGEYLSQFGSYGSGPGQFKGPAGIVTGPSGNAIFVVDRGNHRVHRFTKSGGIFGQVGSYGWEDAKFDDPTGIALGGPSGESTFTILIVDSGNNRVQRFSPLGVFLGKFGSYGSANGQLDSPGAINTDSAGNVWIGDRNNGRVQGFNSNGEYLTQFGSPGSGNGQFSFVYPMGIAGNPQGTLWVTDAGNNRLQRWSQANWRSEITTEIRVDGKSVNTGVAGCTSEQCPIVREWTLGSSAWAPGKHSVVVKGTDGLGNTASKTLEVEVQPDTTKPTLETGGELAEAPEGWVEQESYGLTATASDNGYGITSLVLRIDGQQVASSSQACPDGGCSGTLSKSIDMSAYSGGAHPAELVVTDGAGNTATKHWTINVDPDGQITVGEAEDTLDAADATSESTVVAPTAEIYNAEERIEGNDPSLVKDGDELESRGTSNLSAISVDPDDGFTIIFPETALHAEPTHISEESLPMVIAEETVAMSSNTRHNVDTVIRPIFNGLTTFQSIRDISGPETYSWEVLLNEGQTLRSVDPLDAEIVNEDGMVVTLITAEPAHDAIGANVPTSLAVSEGNIVTLTVSHRQASFIYPVVAGSGWEGGYTTEIVLGPKDEQEIKEDEERIAREEQERINREAEEEMSEGADEFSGQYDDIKTPGPEAPRRLFLARAAPEMWDWQQRKRRSKFEVGYCNGLSCGHWHTWGWGTFFWNGERGRIGGYAWRGNTAAKCATEADHVLTDTTLHAIGWSGPNPAPYGYGKYLNYWCSFRYDWINATGPATNYYQIQSHLYGSGYQGDHIKEFSSPVLEG